MAMGGTERDRRLASVPEIHYGRAAQGPFAAGAIAVIVVVVTDFRRFALASTGVCG